MKMPLMKSFLVSAAVGLMLTTHARLAVSDLLRWNLQNVLFTDGGVASGFFSLDTTQTNGSLADFDIKVSGGEYPSFEYTPGAGISGGWGPLSGTSNVGAFFSTASGRNLVLIPTLTQAGTNSLNSIRFSIGGRGDLYFPWGTLSREQIGSLPTDAPRWVRTGSLTTGTPQLPSHGTLVRWTLDGVKFDTGGTATGSFIYDASAGTVLDFDFQGPFQDVNQSFPCQPIHGIVDNAGVCWVAFGLSFENGRFQTPAGSLFFNLVPEKALTDKGGIVLLAPGSTTGAPVLLSGTGGGSLYYNSFFLLTAGRLTGTVIPEPSGALLFALGLGALLGYFAWRRHQAFAKRHRGQVVRP